jgi:Sulfotransferase family
MIISRQHKFIFVAVPKTGTHSVRRALRTHMGPDDHEQVGLFIRRLLPYPELAALQHGHLSLSQVRPHIGEEAFQAYFKFAFVRNPFDRFVSYCAFMSRDNGEFERNPRGVMSAILAEPPKDHILFAPQHAFVADNSSKILADAIGRVEDMQTHYDNFAGRLGFATTLLERANGSRRGEYRAYYNDALVEGVSALYRRDLELFDYRF